MEAISFIQEVSKKGKAYRNIWLHILLKYEQGKPIAINTNIKFDNVSASTYYRIIDYGISVFPSIVKNYYITKNRGEIIIIKKQQSEGDIREIFKEAPKTKVLAKVEKSVEPKTKQPKELYDEIINYLNECTGQSYKSSSKATQMLIDARLKDKFTLEDFRQVISTKATKWLNTKFQDYLRPQTLFSNKFESYLNETIIVEKNKQQQAHDTVVQATELGWNNQIPS